MANAQKLHSLAFLEKPEEECQDFPRGAKGSVPPEDRVHALHCFARVCFDVIDRSLCLPGLVVLLLAKAPSWLAFWHSGIIMEMQGQLDGVSSPAKGFRRLPSDFQSEVLPASQYSMPTLSSQFRILHALIYPSIKGRWITVQNLGVLAHGRSKGCKH